MREKLVVISCYDNINEGMHHIVVSHIGLLCAYVHMCSMCTQTEQYYNHPTLNMMSIFSPVGSELRNDNFSGTVLELKNELDCGCV